MIQLTRNDPQRVGALDYLLTGTMIAVTVYAATQSLGVLNYSSAFVSAALIGCLFSYAVTRLMPADKASLLSGIAYAAIGAFALFVNPNFLPEDNPQLVMPRFLVWLLVTGSFAMWQDSTLLFQAVPCVALLALVGVYDTFKGAVLCFFLFLLCLATLMGRAHSRLMMKQAVASGFRRVEMLKESQWRWVAGPEWALGSALAVVIISILGAPYLQESVQGIAGVVKFNPPVSKDIQKPAIFSGPSDSVTSKVGQGPRSLTSTIVFYATLDHPRYMRVATYNNYMLGGWGQRNPDGVGDNISQYARGQMKNPLTYQFKIEPVALATTGYPMPAEVSSLSDTRALEDVQDGTWRLKGGGPAPSLSGTAMQPEATLVPTKADREMPARFEPYTVLPPRSYRVAQLAEDVTANAKTDWDKANAIKEEIDRRCKYNLFAAATPERRDPVNYFLFESKEGYCDLFASSMVLMARSVGIPARYVTGYYPVRDEKDGQGRYVIRSSDAHAWAELFFEDAGWVVFDATEGAVSVPGSARGDATVQLWFETFWFRFIVIPAAMVAIGYLLYGLQNLIKAARETKIETSLKTARAYRRFETMLRRAVGHPRRLSQTSREYVDASKVELGPAYEIAQQVNTLFEEALFSPKVSEATLNSLEAESDRLKKALDSRPNPKKR
ncbi:MAG: transglutaminase domain-containing protein [Armatimonadetes bacterium]|nr:transglutaminase domain-containing protein [Armatimonadota bacterium]